MISGLDVTINSSDNLIYGGLIGYMTSPGVVTRIGFTGSVSATTSGINARAGGLVGYADTGTTISYSFASGDVDAYGAGVGTAGGLVGFGGGSIQDSYATGDDTTLRGDVDRYAGGLAGYLSQASTIRTFATGRSLILGSSGTSSVGGYAGIRQVGTMTGNFWDTTTSGTSSAYGFGFGTGDPVGRTTAQMQSFATFDDSAWPIVNGWAPFDPVAGNVWGICEGSTYPFLLWQYTSNTRPCAGAPATPVIASVTPMATTASVAFNADDSGGSTITRLEFALDDTTVVDDSTASPTSPFTLTGLQPSTGYVVYMRSVNSVGAGPWSTPSAFTTTSPTPPTPPAPVPPVVSAPPREIQAVAGDASVTASWLAPESTGSYPVSTYQATASPGGSACLTTSTICTIEGLTNGVAYTVTVRALTGAGWSPASEPSAAVTPRAERSRAIVITGSRGKGTERGTIFVRGTSQGLTGETVTMWLTFGPSTPTPAPRTTTVTDDGTFAWSRRSNRTVTVYAEAGGVRSNSITLRAR